jgi:hypothetical protein
MSKTIKQTMDAVPTVGDLFGPPWYVRLVQSQGVGNVILLMIAVALMAATPSLINLAKATAAAQAAQTELHRHIETSLESLTKNSDQTLKDHQRIIGQLGRMKPDAKP